LIPEAAVVVVRKVGKRVEACAEQEKSGKEIDGSA